MEKLVERRGCCVENVRVMGGALKSDNTDHYECYLPLPLNPTSPPGLAIKGTGITLRVTAEGADGSEHALNGNRKCMGGARVCSG